MSIVLKPLHQQVIVITGASSGIGLAAAQLAAQKGARLVLAARSLKTLETVVEALGGKEGMAIAVQADVARRQDVENIAVKAVAQFGRIDTWVNNAGVSIYGRLTEVSDEDSRRLFDVNFWGVVNGSLVALEHLRTHGGAIINLGSEVSDAVIPLQGMYAASKHAVKGFTDALRIEVERVDRAPVAITLIQPTAVDTPYPQHAKNYMAHEPKLPSPRIAPKAVARAILQAAAHPRRDVTVGAMAKLNTTLSKLAPAIADRLAASYVTKQHHEESPRDPQGTLYKAGESGHVRSAERPFPVTAGGASDGDASDRLHN